MCVSLLVAKLAKKNSIPTKSMLERRTTLLNDLEKFEEESIRRKYADNGRVNPRQEGGASSPIVNL